MSQLMLQAPGSQNAGTGTWNDVRFSGRANQQNVIKFDGVEGSAIIDASPGNIAGQIASPFKLQASLENVQEFRVESNNYPAEFGTGTGGQVSVVTKSGVEPVPRLAVRVLPQRQARRAELLRLDAQHRRQRHPGAAEVEAQPAPVRRLVRRSDHEGPRVLLRQLRRLPARRRRQLRRSGAERRGVGAGGAGDRRRCVPASRRPSAVLLPGASANPDFDIYQLQSARERRGELVQRPPRLPHQPAVDRRTSASSTTAARSCGRKASAAASSRVTNKPTNAIFNLQGTLGGGLLNEFKVGYNAPPTRHPRRRADRQRHRLRQPRHQPERLDRQHRHRRPERARRASSCPAAWCARTARPTAAAASTTRTRSRSPTRSSLVRGNHLVEVRRRRPDDPDDDRPAGRHDLHLPERHRVPRQPAVGDSVPRRHQRAERVQQRRDRACATPSSSTTSRFAQDEWHADVEPDAQLRPALRLLHAAEGDATT